MDDVKKSIWYGILEKGYGKDFTHHVTMKFKDGGISFADPEPTGKLRVPRKMLPNQNYSGIFQLDCNLFTGTVIGSFTIK
jgi:hypothetical protein